MSWMVYAAIMMVGSAVFNICLKYSDGHIEPVVGAFLLQLAATVLATFLLIGYQAQSDTRIVWTMPGVTFSVVAGLVIMIVNYSAFAMFNQGAPLSVAVPLIKTATVLITVAAGFVLFREQFTWEKLTGIVLCLSGIYLLVRHK